MIAVIRHPAVGEQSDIRSPVGDCVVHGAVGLATHACKGREPHALESPAIELLPARSQSLGRALPPPACEIRSYRRESSTKPCGCCHGRVRAFVIDYVAVRLRDVATSVPRLE